MVKKSMKKNQARFSFGTNWQNFVDKALTPERIHGATESLRSFFGLNDYEGLTFLDIGCGSGLFSLAARRLGAKVHSFDLDPLSVACATELRRRYFPEDEKWTIDQGDVLDVDYINSLGKFDLVYSWGVLHHTGAMWEALGNVTLLVAEGGKLYISIYNDQGTLSRRWRRLKKFYNQSPKPIQLMIILGIGTLLQTYSALVRVGQGENPFPFKEWADKKKNRGMSVWYDLVDWVGGYPFEVAKPEEIFGFYFTRGFHLVKLKTCGGGLGCNEFVFVREKVQTSAFERTGKIS
jgi:2-polyprenyl-3-methyl-5-hydroxy-6-metoxy-1,4-benzoquinol methylase